MTHKVWSIYYVTLYRNSWLISGLVSFQYGGDGIKEGGCFRADWKQGVGSTSQRGSKAPVYPNGCADMMSFSLEKAPERRLDSTTLNWHTTWASEDGRRKPSTRISVLVQHSRMVWSWRQFLSKIINHCCFSKSCLSIYLFCYWEWKHLEADVKNKNYWSKVFFEMESKKIDKVYLNIAQLA